MAQAARPYDCPLVQRHLDIAFVLILLRRQSAHTNKCALAYAFEKQNSSRSQRRVVRIFRSCSFVDGAIKHLTSVGDYPNTTLRTFTRQCRWPGTPVQSGSCSGFLHSPSSRRGSSGSSRSCSSSVQTMTGTALGPQLYDSTCDSSVASRSSCIFVGSGSCFRYLHIRCIRTENTVRLPSGSNTGRAFHCRAQPPAPRSSLVRYWCCFLKPRSVLRLLPLLELLSWRYTLITPVFRPRDVFWASMRSVS